MREMCDEPVAFGRPVIVAGGWNSPGVIVRVVADRLREMTTTPELVHEVSFFSTGTFDTGAARLIEKVEEAAPSDDPSQTVEVDVVAISMGGLVARYAALPEAPGGKRLVIKRLFTVSTPHRGAQMASDFTIDDRVRDMVSGSEFLARLDEAVAMGEADYEVVPYARTHDWIVGTKNASWTDGTLHWVPNVPGSPAHFGAATDRRVAADIARRLRGEAAYAHTGRTN
jgi:pimeloyl-ACP methyl ester carboxylesterase